METQEQTKALDIHLDAHPYKHSVAINGLPFRLAESISIEADSDDMTKITFTCFIDRHAGLEVSGLMEGRYQLGDNKPEVLRQHVHIWFEDVAALTQVKLDGKPVPRLVEVHAGAKAGEATMISLRGIDSFAPGGEPVEWIFEGPLVPDNTVI